jgi:hypothetical protein
MFKKIIIAVVLLGSIGLFAHEGHDATPGALKSNHGGVVKAGKEINLEYVVSGAEVKLYPVSHEGVDLSVNDITLAVTSKLPKGKPMVLKTEVVNGVYTAQVDFKNAYRLEMNVDTSFKNKKSTFKFQLEK